MANQHSHVIASLAFLAALLPASAAVADIDGEALFRNNCAPCHGEDGRGGGSAASVIAAPIPQLATLTERNGGVFPEDYVVRVIDGRDPILEHGSRNMPVWGSVFEGQAAGEDDAPSAAELIEAIVSYVKGLQVE